MIFWMVRNALLFGLVIASLFALHLPLAKAGQWMQIPTVAIPTVTSSPQGTMITVGSEQDQINVRGGPSTDYPIVGILIAGQQVPALGRSPGGDWVQVVYPGVPGGVAWVYSPLVRIAGDLPIVEPPATPTPQTTPTIDPTLAAQFIVEMTPTRLPTFTPPPPLVIPTFAGQETPASPAGIPMGFVIVGLGAIGLFGTLISLLRGR